MKVGIFLAVCFFEAVISIATIEPTRRRSTGRARKFVGTGGIVHKAQFETKEDSCRLTVIAKVIVRLKRRHVRKRELMRSKVDRYLHLIEMTKTNEHLEELHSAAGQGLEQLGDFSEAAYQYQSAAIIYEGKGESCQSKAVEFYRCAAEAMERYASKKRVNRTLAELRQDSDLKKAYQFARKSYESAAKVANNIDDKAEGKIYLHLAEKNRNLREELNDAFTSKRIHALAEALPTL